MAIDVEPDVFWNGDDAAEKVDEWKVSVGFVDGVHGKATPAKNGPSGTTLDGYFTGMGIDRDETVLLDVYPVYLTKRNPSSEVRQQGDAIDEVYNDYLEHMPPGPHGPWPSSQLPTRPPARDGVGVAHRAVDEFGPWIIEVLRHVRPEQIVTLGDEPWWTLQRLAPTLTVVPPADSLSATLHSGYGKPGSIGLDGRTARWLPLAHPGLLMMQGSQHGETPPASSFLSAHNAWVAGAGSA